MGEKIYLAGRWRDRYRLRDVRARLRDLGYEVTSRWIDDEGRPDDYQWSSSEYPTSVAQRDLEDVDDATLFILDLTEGTSTRGGMYFEAGFFLGMNKNPAKLWIVGPPINVFTYMPEFPHFRDWDEVFADLEIAQGWVG